MAGGEVVAESTRAHFVLETGMPTRYYLLPEDARTDLLTVSETQTSCPYKGDAVYWSANIGDESFSDIVWSYPEPLPEVGKIKDLLCFFNERVDGITVDGVAIESPQTKWSKSE